MFHEEVGRHDRDLARLDVGLVDHALHAAEMIDVRMRVDHRRHRPVATMGAVERQRRARSFDAGQRVDDDDAGLALDDRHVGDVEAAHLVDALAHLEQAVPPVELGDAPQARVDAVGRGPVVDEGVLLLAPGLMAAGGQHRRVGDRGDEAAIGVGEVAAIGEGQFVQNRLVAVDDLCCGRRRALGLARHGVTSNCFRANQSSRRRGARAMGRPLIVAAAGKHWTSPEKKLI